MKREPKREAQYVYDGVLYKYGLHGILFTWVEEFGQWVRCDPVDTVINNWVKL